MKLANLVSQAQAAVLLMKEHGLLVDRQRMQELQVQQLETGAQAERQLQQVLSDPLFNPKSPQQVAALLYDKFSLPKQYNRGKASVTTDDSALEKISKDFPDAAPICDLILSARRSTKLASTYYNLTFPDADDRVRPDWKMHGTETGRYSCSTPPIQTYPPGAPRSIFVAPPGKKLGYYDLSQIEFRIMMWASRDPAGMELLSKGGDIHKETASLIFQKPQSDIQKEERFQAKFINYGLPYGRGPESMALQHNLTIREAQDIYDRHHHRFHRLWDWLAELNAFSKETKHIANPFGRKRWFIEESDPERERQTQNFIPQSTGHDLLMHMHVDVVKELPHINIIADMHDALLTEQPADFDPQTIVQVFERERLPGLVTPAEYKLMRDWGEGGR